MLTGSCYMEPMVRILKTILLMVLLVGPALPAGALESAPVSSPRATV